MESYRYNPSKIEVISWLGIHNVKNEVYEKAVEFFERAAQIQPKEVKWRLMVASCFRRMNHFPQALEMYESINRDHPDNIECLRYLVTISKEMNKTKEQHDYLRQLN
jgi:intraflagellar transport protein 88